MTVPHLENCFHTDYGWCAECVRKQGEEARAFRERIAALEKQVKDARGFAEHLRAQALKEADRAAAVEKQRDAAVFALDIPPMVPKADYERLKAQNVALEAEVAENVWAQRCRAAIAHVTDPYRGAHLPTLIAILEGRKPPPLATLTNNG